MPAQKICHKPVPGRRGLASCSAVIFYGSVQNLHRKAARTDGFRQAVPAIRLPVGLEVCIIRSVPRCYCHGAHSSTAVVVVAQLVESRIVIPVVAGSSPVDHPKNTVI